MRTVHCSGRLDGGSLSGGVEGLPRAGVCPGGRGCLPGGEADNHPINRITDRCKNITFPQLLLRTVKNGYSATASTWELVSRQEYSKDI